MIFVQVKLMANSSVENKLVHFLILNLDVK